MYEVEVKVPADLQAVRERLDDAGAEPIDSLVQVDTYYDAPHRSFATTDEALRIRNESPYDDGTVPSAAATDEREVETKLTYKGSLVDDESKTREEIETEVGDEGEMEAILTNLGFSPAATVRKRRRRFGLDGYTVALDSVDGVGEFVEVETDADEATIGEAREGAFDVLERLDLDPADGIRTSYLELVLDG